MMLGNNGRAVWNLKAYERARERNDEWKPAKDPPYVKGRDPYVGLKRTPEDNFSKTKS